MGKLSILMVAPEHPDLPNVAAEVAAVAAHHETVVLTGVVRDADVARAIEEGPYDVIWFASHGLESGIQLSDGLLSIDGCGQYVRASEAGLCVLNTCESELVALSIVATTDANTICTIADVYDRDASRLGILLARELGRTDDYHDAYQQVRPANGNYRYYQAGHSGIRKWEREDDQLRMLTESIYELRADVRVIRTWLLVIMMALALVVLVEVILLAR